MSRAKLDGEARVREYLTGVGLRAERFSEAEKRQGKTPDFRVYANGELAVYCEVKTAQEDEWLDRQLDAAPPGTIVGGLRRDPIYGRLENYIHNAVEQLDAVNPDLRCPNVLAIVNADIHADIQDLVSVLAGNLKFPLIYFLNTDQPLANRTGGRVLANRSSTAGASYL